MEARWMTNVGNPGRAASSAYQPVDELDEQILWEFIRNGRITISELAALLNVSPSTVSVRASALKRAGVLKSSHAEIDFRRVGLPIQAMVFVRLRAQARPHVQEYANLMTRLPSVLNLYFMGGDEDFLIHLVCTSTNQLRDIVATEVSMHPVVASTRTHIIYEHALGADHMDHLTGFDEVRRPIGSSRDFPGVFDQ
ncbi:Lrp/AsnC family transcriptional regulator [Arthrobacter sp. AET 35A]|jgi:DNA-binding Lrp family transcriptional regulator|nr:Lrp/AsnC family transcriptional regulator [Arthrobacter sp. AET 35A]